VGTELVVVVRGTGWVEEQVSSCTKAELLRWGIQFVMGKISAIRPDFIDKLEQNQNRCALPHVRKNKDEIQGPFPFAALEGQDDDFKK
jgi:hypothetical protein